MGAYNKLGERSPSSTKIMVSNSTTTCGAPDPSGTVLCYTAYAADPSSTAATSGGFTYGEIVNGVFLFLILAVVSMTLFHLVFRKIKIKN